MKKESGGLLLNCKEVHALVSQGLDRKLNTTEQARMRLHFLVCSTCSNFNGQMQTLRQAMRKFPFDEPEQNQDQEPK